MTLLIVVFIILVASIALRFAVGTPLERAERKERAEALKEREAARQSVRAARDDKPEENWNWFQKYIVP